MPVSSPSYFPPSRTGDVIVGNTAGTSQTGASDIFLAMKDAGRSQSGNTVIAIGNAAAKSNTGNIVIALGTNAAQNNTIGDIIALGNNSGGGSSTGLADAHLRGSIFIGTGAGANAVIDTNTGTGCVAIGYNCGNQMTTAGAMTLVGTNLMPTANAGSGSMQNVTAIGASSLLGNYGTLEQSVVLGSFISNNPVGGFATLNNMVIIGVGALFAGPHVPGYDESVVIGHQACQGRIAMQETVAIGGQVDVSGGGTALTQCVFVGSQITILGNAVNSVVIGAFADAGNTGNANVIIGWGANSAPKTGYSNKLIIEQAITVGVPPALALVFGDFTTGSIVLGGSLPATRDLGGTNILKLLSGTTIATPVGGGYYYVDGANNTDMPVHWVDAAGANVSLTGSGPRALGTGLGVISPAALPAGNTNDWAPTGLGQAQVIRVTGDAGGSTLTGILAGTVPGRLLTLINVSANTITLAHQVTSLPANQFSLPGAVNLNLTQFSSIRLWYDTGTSTWISIARSN